MGYVHVFGNRDEGKGGRGEEWNHKQASPRQSLVVSLPTLTHARIFYSTAHWIWLFWLLLLPVLGSRPGFWSSRKSPSPAKITGTAQGSSPASSALWKASLLPGTWGESGLRWGGRAADSHWECQGSWWHKRDMESQGWCSIPCLKKNELLKNFIRWGGGAQNNTFFPKQV